MRKRQAVMPPGRAPSPSIDESTGEKSSVVETLEQVIASRGLKDVRVELDSANDSILVNLTWPAPIGSFDLLWDGTWKVLVTDSSGSRSKNACSINEKAERCLGEAATSLLLGGYKHGRFTADPSSVTLALNTRTEIILEGLSDGKTDRLFLLSECYKT